MSVTPDRAHQLYLDGNRHLSDGDLPTAEICYLKALAREPAHAAALANLACIEERRGALADAEQHYVLALALMPDHPQLLQNLGLLLLKIKRFDGAETALRRAVELAPQLPAAWSNLGVLLACVKQEAEAEQCQRSALALQPDDARARYNLGYLLLRQGRMDEGWGMLESRWQFDRLPAWFDCPRWDGGPLAGRSIAIGIEAGHGDMIQFCRYAALLKTAGAARVTLLCHPGLKTLFATLPGVDAVLSLDDIAHQASAQQDWDCWTLPMSLPAHFHTTPDTIPAPIPYLAPPPARVEHWRRMLAAGAGAGAGPGQLRVGLAWRGNANFENDADRSLPSLATLGPLAEVAEVAEVAGVAGVPCVSSVLFVSLQKGPGEAQALQPPAGMALLPLGPTLEDFADTAALISCLDLVISVDTAVAHLAGALGKPCWLLLPDYRCDWRWLTGRDDTPWYPSMRLFRQPPGGGWDGVIEAVAAALKLHAAQAPGQVSYPIPRPFSRP